MGGISGGSNRSNQNNQSSSNAWNVSGNQSSNYGGQQSSTAGGQQATSGQDIWGGQQPALQQLYQTAQGLLSGQGSQSAGAQGVANDARGAWLQQLQPGGNPYFSQSMQGAIDAATRGFNQNVLPGLADAGVAAGAYGMPRDQLARGQAAGQFGQDLTNMVGQMATQQYQGDQNRALGALGMSGQMQGLQLAPLQLAGQMIGGPTVLGQSQSSGFNTGQSYGYNVGQSSGFSQGGATSQGTGSGASRGKNFGASMGG